MTESIPSYDGTSFQDIHVPTVHEVLQSGWRTHQSGNPVAAERVYRGVLAQVPRNAEAHVYLGIALFDQRRFTESASAYREALGIREVFPVAWNNLGNSLRMLGEIEEAESCFIKALEQQPGYLSALKNRGTLWIWSGEIERGLKWYEAGLQVDPDNAELHRNLGVINLLLGRFDIGWREYRWRWKMPGAARPAVNAPLWNGEELNGKTILLYPEQGRGDAIQFIRVASVLAKLGARIFLRCSAAMIPLFASARASSKLGIDLLLPEGGVIPPVDHHASLIDVIDTLYQHDRALPYASDLFDADGRGYLSVPDNLIHYWQNWLDQHVPRPSAATESSGNVRRIGINWQGNPQHHADVYRSIPLDELQPLTQIPNVQLVSLQFGFGSEQLDQSSFRQSIAKLPSNLDESGGAFMDTAAVLCNLDHLITTDTALAHLAGALGVPVTVLLGKVPDWRWLTEGETTPWYPTMRLARQTEMGRWDDVVQQVGSQLEAS